MTLASGRTIRYERCVHEQIGTSESVTTVVDGRTDDYQVALWVERGELQHRCECPSWLLPCKHEVAAADGPQGVRSVSSQGRP